MDLFEYQARELLLAGGVPVHSAQYIEAPQQVSEVKELPVVIKAQVKTGGRGLAGGVKVAKNRAELAQAAEQIFGLNIKGHTVNSVLIAPAVEILAEYYASITFDRLQQDYVLMFSKYGGMEIEKLAVERPDDLHIAHFLPAFPGVTEGSKSGEDAKNGIAEAIANVLEAAQMEGEIADWLADVISKLWAVYSTQDATLVEVNPLALCNSPSANQGTTQAQNPAIYALDAKISLDDNASFRHQETFAKYRSVEGENPLETYALSEGINYVHLDGDVGIIGNGAGLVMSSLDVVALFGGKPANFLDIGGGASAEQMRKSLELVLQDEKVRVVLINIFGGLTQCDLVARGILAALSAIPESQRRPIVVHFNGNAAREGLEILQAANNPLIRYVESLEEAAHLLKDVPVEGGCASGVSVITPPPSGVKLAASLIEGRGEFKSEENGAHEVQTPFGGSGFPQLSDKCIVQGITGSEGFRHTQRMLRCGTQIVGGVNPRKAGEVLDFYLEDAPAGEAPAGESAQQPAHLPAHLPAPLQLPVYASVQEAVEKTGATVSVVFVPPQAAKSAVLEAISGGIKTVVVITEGIPQQDSIEFVTTARARGVRVIGPNCPGLVTFPAEHAPELAPAPALESAPASVGASSNFGIIPDKLSRRGVIGLVSKSGTLTYQMMHDLADIGFTAAVGIGGDACIGTTHIDAIREFEADPATKLIVMIGEIGGSAEEEAARYIKQNVTKPVIAYIAGVTAPEGKTMGHAGAIIQRGVGTARSKKEALLSAGVRVGDTPEETARLVRETMQTISEYPR